MIVDTCSLLKVVIFILISGTLIRMPVTISTQAEIEFSQSGSVKYGSHLKGRHVTWYKQAGTAESYGAVEKNFAVAERRKEESFHGSLVG